MDMIESAWEQKLRQFLYQLDPNIKKLPRKIEEKT